MQLGIHSELRWRKQDVIGRSFGGLGFDEVGLGLKLRQLKRLRKTWLILRLFEALGLVKTYFRILDPMVSRVMRVGELNSRRILVLEGCSI